MPYSYPAGRYCGRAEAVSRYYYGNLFRRATPFIIGILISNSGMSGVRRINMPAVFNASLDDGARPGWKEA